MHISDLSPEVIFEIALQFEVSPESDHGRISKEKVLRNLALVSKQFREAAQQILFRYLILDNYVIRETDGIYEASPRKFKILLISSPHIASHVRALHLTDKAFLRASGDELVDVLPRLTNLTRMDLHGDFFKATEWRQLSTAVQDVLMKTMRMPSVSQLSLSSMGGLPLACLEGAKGVTSLGLRSCAFSLPSDAAANYTAIPLKLRSLEVRRDRQGKQTESFWWLLSPPGGGRPVLSLCNLKSLYWSCTPQPDDGGPTPTMILSHVLDECASSLRSLTIAWVHLLVHYPAQSPIQPILTQLKALHELKISATTSALYQSSASGAPLDPLVAYFLPLFGSLPQINGIANIRVELYLEDSGTEHLVAMRDWRWGELDSLLSSGAQLGVENGFSSFPLLDKFELWIVLFKGHVEEAKAIVIDGLTGIAGKGLLSLSVYSVYCTR